MAARPQPIPAATNFILVRAKLAPLQDWEVLGDPCMSVDPRTRGRRQAGFATQAMQELRVSAEVADAPPPQLLERFYSSRGR